MNSIDIKRKFKIKLNLIEYSMHTCSTHINSFPPNIYYLKIFLLFLSIAVGWIIASIYKNYYFIQFATEMSVKLPLFLLTPYNIIHIHLPILSYLSPRIPKSSFYIIRLFDPSKLRLMSCHTMLFWMHYMFAVF